MSKECYADVRLAARKSFYRQLGVLAGIEKSILINVFHESRKRPHKYIDAEGE
jgi:hypothetical protein